MACPPEDPPQGTAPAGANPQRFRFGDGEMKDQLAAYAALRAYESDFDKAQGTLRVVASTWILATVGALGYLVLQANSRATLINPAGGGLIRTEPPLELPLAVLLCQLTLLLGSCGVLGLWYIDQRVYQRLLHTTFAYGCHIEQLLSAVPAVRRYMFRRAGDVGRSLGKFYEVPIYLMLLAALLNLILATYLAWPPGFYASTATPPTGSLAAICIGKICASLATVEWLFTVIVGAGHSIAVLYVIWISSRWNDLKEWLPEDMKVGDIDQVHQEAIERLKPRSRA